MAQVDSEPGVSQAAQSVVVPNVVVEPGASQGKVIASNTVVVYMQSEPGKHDAKRS